MLGHAVCVELVSRWVLWFFELRTCRYVIVMDKTFRQNISNCNDSLFD